MNIQGQKNNQDVLKCSMVKSKIGWIGNDCLGIG